eukprot:GILJ01001703.1.p1 GENE.GILJ01001703.1~~GILJ01001703.1.p1  ORF type:complete len:196 (+),score=25.49 GILJ01001703.1:168-755(+)
MQSSLVDNPFVSTYQTQFRGSSETSETERVPAIPSIDSKNLQSRKYVTANTFFENTKVKSSQKIVMHNGQPVAIPFPHKATGYKAKNSYENMPRTEGTSSYRRDFTQKREFHTGMKEKPLEPYNPNALRSRLWVEPLKIPVFNASQIKMKAGHHVASRRFVTNHKNEHCADTVDPTTNQGIVSMKTKFRHHMQAL